MSELPPCPECNSPYVYADRDHLVCPECGHEWSPGDAIEADSEQSAVTDANIRLVEGDHDIDCRIDGIGAMKLKSEFLKKA